ncbi:hypothetical protein K0M31_004575 [Melipona bicolor]|uniref:Uncharacterized protein n=1 Tax=Melipona bicolor TaxID=60889 RepID=A0AA40FXU2_9HYME|nr:hypothetical protein K0M31_004575 [Melipona bicolor]
MALWTFTDFQFLSIFPEFDLTITDIESKCRKLGAKKQERRNCPLIAEEAEFDHVDQFQEPIAQVPIEFLPNRKPSCGARNTNNLESIHRNVQTKYSSIVTLADETPERTWLLPTDVSFASTWPAGRAIRLKDSHLY